jgi:DNA-directed RNA polymerase subunit N (RpoN/RPB10)
MSIMSPVWCVHCRGSLGDKIEAWERLRPENDHESINRDGRTASDILTAIGLERACCRAMVMTYNARIEDYNKYKRTNIFPKQSSEESTAIVDRL